MAGGQSGTCCLGASPNGLSGARLSPYSQSRETPGRTDTARSPTSRSNSTRSPTTSPTVNRPADQVQNNRIPDAAKSAVAVLKTMLPAASGRITRQYDTPAAPRGTTMTSLGNGITDPYTNRNP